MTLTCVDCGVTETLTKKDEERFEHLLKTISGFQTPKRCNACRKRRREDKPGTAIPLKAAIVPPAAPPAPPAPAAPPAEAPKVLLVLATKDFDDLVHGHPVIWSGVKVVLADIGFTTMRKAIDDAELEKAKKLVKSNGH